MKKRTGKGKKVGRKIKYFLVVKVTRKTLLELAALAKGGIYGNDPRKVAARLIRDRLTYLNGINLEEEM